MTEALRPPEEVMRLAVMGSAHRHRLSFMRLLLRCMKREAWRFHRAVWNLDDDGYGHAVYVAEGPLRSYSLVAFSHYLAPENRTDRVIATAWDTSFALFDGVPDRADIARLAENVPKQEAGRVTARELSVSRANRSVRLFDHVVESLAAGRQPDRTLVEEVGYLMRTTAVYGSGKLGAADYEANRDRPEFTAPYQAEMLSVYLTRDFTVDLAEHMARRRAPARAVGLEPTLRRRLGIGNATGLGMAPYLINHPVVLNQWVMARETALARVRALVAASPVDHAGFMTLVQRARLGVASWHTDDAIQTGRIAELAGDLERLESRLADGGFDGRRPWDRLYRWADAELSLEARELVVSLLLEPHGDLVDDLESLYVADEFATFAIDGAMTVAEAIAAIERDYGWALALDFSPRRATARFWYTSVEKLEPRLGERWEEAGGDLELPLAVGRDIQACRRDLKAFDAAAPLAVFLLAHPEHRHVVRRSQMRARHPYAEICDNVIGAAMRPIDFLRFKLAFFGAARFDPRSDRWTRITMYQDAPFAMELDGQPADDWFLPQVK
ncbi:MAG: hypothetical protein HY245_12175 [Rhizobiales bacterium]|nr:hypothetical protein [Hyphomicrobiales bacterium]MBI3674145.1 hypothetical protein [Hyphomicrobiales bacterium]